MSLTRKQILDAPITIKEVETPEWGGDGITHVRMIPIKAHFEFSQKNTDLKGKVKEVGGFIVKYLLLAICDNKGNRLFLDEDEDKLSEKSSLVLMRIYDVAKELNGDDIEDIAKNSEKTQSEDSVSD